MTPALANYDCLTGLWNPDTNLHRVLQNLHRMLQTLERLPQTLERLPQTLERLLQTLERSPQTVERLPHPLKPTGKTIEPIRRVHYQRRPSARLRIASWSHRSRRPQRARGS